MSEKLYYRTGEFAALVGVTVKTLQKWDREGKLRAHRSPTNRRYYTYEQYEAYMGGGDDSHARDITDLDSLIDAVGSRTAGRICREYFSTVLRKSAKFDEMVEIVCNGGDIEQVKEALDEHVL